jgi:quercetin 2,3-dioxygenase
MSWDVRRAADRAVTGTDWLHSAHSFAFGPHYDPDNLSFGRLLAHNVDELGPGPGYPRHRHASLEILTWVLAGTLEHVDADGSRLVGAGMLQYLSAGAGIEHTERSGSAAEPVRVVQMWLTPSEPDGDPHYAAAEVPLPSGELVPAASGVRPAPIALRGSGAELFLARLPAGTAVALPAAAFVHLFLSAGAVIAAGDGLPGTTRLGPADAVRITGERPVRLTAERDAELLVWAMEPAVH